MRTCFPAVSARLRCASSASLLVVSFLLSFLLPTAAVIGAAAAPAAAHATAARAQGRIRPAFEPKLVRRMTVSGTVRFKIVPRRDGLPHEFAPIGSGGWVAVVRINGHSLAMLKRLPATVAWDTRAAGDGIHEVLVSVRNTRNGNEVGVEGAQVIVDNATADTAAEAAEIARALAARAAARTAGRTPAAEAAVAALPTLTLPEAAKVIPVTPRLSASRSLLGARATALLRSGSRLYLGLPDGGIAFFSPDAGRKRGGSVVRLPVWDGPVRSLATGGGRVWWATQDGRSVYTYSPAARTVTRYDVTAALVPLPPPLPAIPKPQEPSPEETAPPVGTAEGELSETPPPAANETPPAAEVTPPMPAAPVPPAKPTGWVRRVAVRGGHVLLIGDAGMVRVLDPRSGKLADVTAVSDNLLPQNALTGGDGPARIYVAPAGDDSRRPVMVVSVTPAPLPEDESEIEGDSPRSRWRRYLLRAWRSNGSGGWRQVAAFPTDVDPDRAVARLAVSPNAVVTAEREGPRFATDGEPRDMPYSLSPGMPSSTDRVTVGASGLWWEQRGIVFRADPRTGARDAYLPWNVPGGTGAVLALTADSEGVWVATTSAGVRYIRHGRPNAHDGYNGYIRARLGSQTLRPPTTRDSRIADAIEAWQGVRYVWGGMSRSGIDCSGFLLRLHQVGGVSIPRTTLQMRRTPQGGRVRDELRWGDTLVYPGHCAMYTGDGRTAETVGGTREGGVSRSSIWVRSNVVVRRFLP